MQALIIEVVVGEGVVAQVIEERDFYQWKALVKDGDKNSLPFYSKKFLTKIDAKNNLFIFLLKRYLATLSYPAAAVFIKNKKLSVITSNLFAKELHRQQEKDPSKQLVLSGVKSFDFPDGRIGFIGTVKLILH